MSVKLHPHQEEAVEKLHNGCILYGDVGVGKTITSLGYYFSKICNGTINEWGSMETPKDVYVITTAKVRDGKSFELQAAHFGVHTDRDLSTNGVKITVDSWNNLHKYVEVKDAFFIFDEQRVVGYGAWSRAFIKIAKSNGWILLSATPGDTWLDYIPVFIANGWYKHKTDFLDQHVIWTPRVKYPKVLRYQNAGVLVRRRNEVLVHMPYERHTKRHPVDVWCDYDEKLFDKVVKQKWHVFEERPLRDAAELFSVMRKVVNTDSSRLEHLRFLMTKHPKLIVFYNFDYELEMLKTLSDPESLSQNNTASGSVDPTTEHNGKESGSSSTESISQSSTTTTLPESGESSSPLSTGSSPTGKPPIHPPWICNESCPKCQTVVSDEKMEEMDTTSNGDFTVAEWNGHKHEEIPTTERWLYLVQYRAGAEGWNCIETDAICFFSQTYSYRDFFQVHGRIDRLNTPFVDLHYYYLISRSVIDKAIRRAQKAKKSFNERDLVL